MRYVVIAFCAVVAFGPVAAGAGTSTPSPKPAPLASIFFSHGVLPAGSIVAPTSINPGARYIRYIRNGTTLEVWTLAPNSAFRVARLEFADAASASAVAMQLDRIAVGTRVTSLDTKGGTTNLNFASYHGGASHAVQLPATLTRTTILIEHPAP
jgi:hypothetical protein